jgi:hemolysin activation/secretion protein
MALGLAIAGSVAAGPGAGAQSASQAVDPGQIEKRFEVRPKRKQDVAPLIPVIQGELPPERARAISFVLSGLVVEGATVFPQSELAALYEGLLARQVTLEDIYKVAAAIGKKYTDAGYILSRVSVPGQEVELGIIRIRVVEGHLENIIFEGSVKGPTDLLQAYAKKITESQPLRREVLERYILLMNDLPGVSAVRRLVPVPGREGAYNLVITLNQDAEYGFARFDNRGSRFSGPFQGWAGAGLNSAFGRWNNAQARFVTATQTSELTFGDLAYSEVVGADGTKLSAGVSASFSEPGHTLARDKVKTRGLFGSLGAEYPLVRSRRQDLFVGAQLTALDSFRDELGSRVTHDKIRVLRLSTRYGVLDGLDGRNNVNLMLSRGLGLMAATQAGDSLVSRTGAPSDFTKLNFDVSRYQPFGPRWGLLAVVAGQRSATKLFLSEQYGVGGEYIGRGYDPAEIAGDDALAGKIEVQWTSPEEGGFLTQYQYYLGYDHGATWLRSSRDDFELASASLGARLLLKGGYFASLEIAKPLTRQVAALGDNGNDLRLFFVLSANF